MKKIFLLTVLIFISFNFLKAQKKRCGTDEILKIRLQDPVYLQNFLKAKQDIYNYSQQSFKTQATQTNCIKTIQIWVHVVYGDATIAPNSQISFEQINSQMKVLNEDYRKKFGTPGFGNGVDMNIEFVLAGFDYTLNNALTILDLATEEKQLKAIKVKDQSKYLNIWVVDDIDNNDLTGYTNFPWDADKTLDGVIMDNDCFGTEGTQRKPLLFQHRAIMLCKMQVDVQHHRIQ